MNIFSLKQDHTAALDKADNIVAVAAAASRDLTESEKAAFNRHTTEADKLAEQINAAQRRSTLHANMGLHGGFGLGEPAPEPKTPARTTPTSLREAMRSASPADAEQLRAFGNYLNGDMTALADLRPTGDGGVFIPTMVAGLWRGTTTRSRRSGAFQPYGPPKTATPLRSPWSPIPRVPSSRAGRADRG